MVSRRESYKNLARHWKQKMNSYKEKSEWSITIREQNEWRQKYEKARERFEHYQKLAEAKR
jgi:hypothetical protein